MTDRFAELVLFRRIVERSSFSAAAQDLGITSGAASKRFAHLEARLGAQLITRTTRKVGLTDVGRRFYDHAVQVLDLLEQAESSLAALTDAPRGRLRVGAPMSLGLLHVAPAVPAFLARYPELALELVLDDRVVDIIEEGLDLVLRGRSELPDSSMVAQRIGPLERVLVATPSYLEERGSPTRPEDLARHNCLLYSLSSEPAEWRLQDSRGEQIAVAVSGTYTVNSSLALREAALAGMGIARLPAFVVRDDLRGGRLVPVLTEWRPREQSLFYLHPATRRVSPKARAFVEFLRTHLREAGFWSSTSSETEEHIFDRR